MFRICKINLIDLKVINYVGNLFISIRIIGGIED